jgi:iron complex transport system substrate-binding protein
MKIQLRQTSTLLTLALTLLCSCGGNTRQQSSMAGDTIRMKYAENICIVKYDGYTKVELANPWRKGSLLHTFILVDKDAERTNLPEGTVVKVPLMKSAVSSGVHGSLITELGALKSIRAVFEVEYYSNKDILREYKAGRILNLGSSMTPNIEAIIDAHPDALLLSPFENSGYGQLDNLNIPIIDCADYMETSPLGRAEWMKFYGLLYGKAHEADSLFNTVETEYIRLKEMAKTNTSHPKVVNDLITGSTWYVPGGNSTTGQLIADAGGDYIFKNEDKSGSIAMAPEAVFEKSQDADVWIFKYTQPTDKTYDQLAAESPMYSQIKAFKDKNVFGCNLSYVPFYNDLPFHPDRHLKELIKMFCPKSLPDYQLKYYKPVGK